VEFGTQATALLVIDMQNGFCSDEGSVNRIGLPAERLRSVIEPCVRLTRAAQAAGVPVIYTRFVYRPDFADGGVLVRELLPALKTERALTAGSWDAEIIDELQPAEEAFVVDKNRPSGFYATGMEPLLRGLGIENLVVCGVTTNCCVETTVRDASQRDYRTFVVEDAVAEFDDERHAVALQSMAMLFADVVEVNDVLERWQGQTTT
jgi:ureidoacrylate peracid hydrolase